MDVKEKLSIISEHFDISKQCAEYMYYRRKRGRPWYKPGDNKYLEWTPELCQALITADKTIGFDWPKLEFGNEEDYLMIYGIMLDTSFLVNNSREKQENQCWHKIISKATKKKRDYVLKMFM